LSVVQNLNYTDFNKGLFETLFLKQVKLPDISISFLSPHYSFLLSTIPAILCRFSCCFPALAPVMRTHPAHPSRSGSLAIIVNALLKVSFPAARAFPPSAHPPFSILISFPFQRRAVSGAVGK